MDYMYFGLVTKPSFGDFGMIRRWINYTNRVKTVSNEAGLATGLRHFRRGLCVAEIKKINSIQ